MFGPPPSPPAVIERSAIAAPAVAEAAQSDPSSPELSKYDGRIIESIQFSGLLRTRESAASGRLTLHPGERFNSDKWEQGIRNLYNSGIVYDLKTEVLADAHSGAIRLIIHLKDKWTFYPFAYVQTGGDLNTYGGGFLDYNFLGYFTNASVTIFVQNGEVSYDLNAYQEWVGATDYSASTDFSNTITPENPVNGLGEGGFTWARSQQQIMFGKRFGDRIRTYFYAEVFQDSLTQTEPPVQTTVFPIEQYRLRPILIFGKVNHSSYLQSGRQLAFSPVFANVLSADYNYYALSVTFKSVLVWGREDTFAYFLSANAETAVPLAYQFHLGGFDSVRGFSAFRSLGLYSGYGNLEYRPLLFHLRMSFLDIDHLIVQGNVFTDAGVISAGSSESQALWSTGLGLRVHLVKYAGALLRMDLARTLFPSEGYGLSVGVQQFF